MRRFKIQQNFTSDAIFECANLVCSTEKTDGEPNPAISDAQKDARMNVVGLDEEVLLQSPEFWFGQIGDVGCVLFNSAENDLLGSISVVLAGDGEVHLFPDVGEIARPTPELEGPNGKYGTAGLRRRRCLSFG